MFFRIIKIIFILIILLSLFVIGIFFINPSSLIYIYRGDDEKNIWLETKYIPIRKVISDTDFYKAPEAVWSPNGKNFSFFDYVDLEWTKKDWALKIIDTRFFTIKTIFIGDYRTSEYKWLDSNIIRVYVRAGSGVRAYRDISVNIEQPIVMVDDWSSGNWTPEKTF